MIDNDRLFDKIRGKNVIVFDGECVLCSGFFRFIVSIDRDQAFHFITAQSSTGELLYQYFDLVADDYDTNLVLIDTKLYERLHGFFKVMSIIGLPWSLLGVFRLLPTPALDWFYYLIARNRYKLFGRRENCLVPDVMLKGRFIE